MTEDELEVVKFIQNLRNKYNAEQLRIATELQQALRDDFICNSERQLFEDFISSQKRTKK